jgi:hypothetical protein
VIRRAARRIGGELLDGVESGNIPRAAVAAHQLPDDLKGHADTRSGATARPPQLQGSAAVPGNALVLCSQPHPYEINTWHWLEVISRTEGRAIDLGTVPDRYWMRLPILDSPAFG